MGWPSNPLGFIKSGLDSMSPRHDRKGVVHRSPVPSRDKSGRPMTCLVRQVHIAIKVHIYAIINQLWKQ